MSEQATALAPPAPAEPFSHSDAFLRRRFLNWFPLGLTYALLYMGRYNLNVAKGALGSLMTNEDFGVIFGIGTLVYGVVFVVNGPLTDKIGGKRAMLIAAGGSALANLLMGLAIVGATVGWTSGADLRFQLVVLYAANMYFQSFGAVAIVKVNAYWFHVRERGGFSGIFGTMISSGIFLAYTVNAWIIDLARGDRTPRAQDAMWAFFGPAVLLVTMFAIELFLLKDRPSQAGHDDFDTGDASSGDDGKPLPTGKLIWRILSNPIILTVAFIEFCTGVLRQGIMQWLPFYVKQVLVLPDTSTLRNGDWGHWYYVALFFLAATGLFIAARRTRGRRRAWLIISGAVVALTPFFLGGWGGLLFVAGVIGGNVAGWVSDLFFQSRRGPAAGGLYLGMAIACGFMYFTLGTTTPTVSWADADKKAAAAGLDQLKKGDRVLAIAGEPDIDDWKDVQKAVSCLPAGCKGSASYNPATCACQGAKVEGPAADVAAAGTIEARVVREGKEITLRLRDPAVAVADDGTKSWAMRAGDTRMLKAGPVGTLSPLWLGLIAFIMSTCVIGTHGLLSGTATMDFGGRRGAATAVGLIDGFVYLGSSLQSFALGYLTGRDWSYWPLFLLPFALVGFFLTTRIWHAVPKGKAAH